MLVHSNADCYACYLGVYDGVRLHPRSLGMCVNACECVCWRWWVPDSSVQLFGMGLDGGINSKWQSL
ncbi:hypothetical protein R5R35_007072 [Gryllus longicercus]|uniref:Uncharacterized protein n=1 Tax=Gryllus longicercus TaxID=2509291 RepID=A0AAN9V702_9ORTH